ncbi:PAS domain-containing protein [Thermodesulfobacteriota bacterium]
MKSVEKELIAMKAELAEVKQSLQEHEEKFTLLTDQSLMAIGILQDGVFKYVNKCFCEICEQSKSQILAWDVNDFFKQVHPEDLDFVKEQHRKKELDDPNAQTRYQCRVVPQNDKIKWVDLYSKNISYEGKQARLINLIEITDHKETQESLLEEKEFSTQALDLLADTFFVFDPATGKSLRWNKAFREISGYSDEEIKNMKAPNDWYSPEDLSIAAQGIAALQADGKNRIELSLMTKDGI